MQCHEHVSKQCKAGHLSNSFKTVWSSFGLKSYIYIIYIYMCVYIYKSPKKTSFIIQAPFPPPGTMWAPSVAVVVSATFTNPVGTGWAQAASTNLDHSSGIIRSLDEIRGCLIAGIFCHRMSPPAASGLPSPPDFRWWNRPRWPESWVMKSYGSFSFRLGLDHTWITGWSHPGGLTWNVSYNDLQCLISIQMNHFLISAWCLKLCLITRRLNEIGTAQCHVKGVSSRNLGCVFLVCTFIS